VYGHRWPPTRLRPPWTRPEITSSPGSTPMRKTRIRWRRHCPSRCC